MRLAHSEHAHRIATTVVCAVARSQVFAPASPSILASRASIQCAVQAAAITTANAMRSQGSASAMLGGAVASVIIGLAPQVQMASRHVMVEGAASMVYVNAMQAIIQSAELVTGLACTTATAMGPVTPPGERARARMDGSANGASGSSVLRAVNLMVCASTGSAAVMQAGLGRRAKGNSASRVTVRPTAPKTSVVLMAIASNQPTPMGGPSVNATAAG